VFALNASLVYICDCKFYSDLYMNIVVESATGGFYRAVGDIKKLA
jgi:hypothetical protein